MLGRDLISLCQKAEQEIVLVAPFIKLTVLERIFEYLANSTKVRVLTRWYPHEIAAGVSDLEIWPFLKHHSNVELFLRPYLHAKYYRADEYCLVGSANLTLSALGWKTPANVELLLPFSANSPILEAFEATLFAQSIHANDGIYNQILLAVQSLPKPESFPKGAIASALNLDESAFLNDGSSENVEWLPTLRHPEDLYKAYCGDWDRLSLAAQVGAASDLQALLIPPGLNKEEFLSFVSSMVIQQQVTQAVDEFAATPRRFGEVSRFLASRYKDNETFEADNTWQTLMRWLLYFLPDRYQRKQPNYSEVFQIII